MEHIVRAKSNLTYFFSLFVPQALPVFVPRVLPVFVPRALPVFVQRVLPVELEEVAQVAELFSLVSANLPDNFHHLKEMQG